MDLTQHTADMQRGQRHALDRTAERERIAYWDDQAAYWTFRDLQREAERLADTAALLAAEELLRGNIRSAEGWAARMFGQRALANEAHLTCEEWARR